MGAGQRCTMGNEGDPWLKASFCHLYSIVNFEKQKCFLYKKIAHKKAFSRTTENTCFFSAGV